MAGYCTRIDVTLLGRRRVPGSRTTAGASRSTPIPSTRTSRRPRSCSPPCTPGGSSAGPATRSPAASTASGSRWSTPSPRRLVLEIDRNGKHHVMEFVNGGEPKGKLADRGRGAPRGRTGTTVSFWPDPAIFEEIEFRAQTVTERLQVMAFLNKGLEIRFADERPGDEQEGDLPVQRRHRRLREAPQRVEGVALPQGRLLRAGRGRARRSRSPSSGTPGSTRASSPSPTGSRPPRAACTRRASRRP